MAKILNVIPSVNPQSGGPIEGLLQSSQVLGDLGHESEIVSMDAKGVQCLKSCPFVVHAMGPGIGSYGYAKRLVPWIANNAQHFDAILVHGLWQYHSLAVRNALAGKGMPYFLFTHGMLDPWFKYKYPLKHLKKWLYWPWAEYRVLRDAEKVFFTSEEERIKSRESFWLYRCNERVVKYGTAGHTGDVGNQKALFLDEFPDLKDKRFLLFLSRIHPKKGVDLLIEAFAEKHYLDPNLQLVIAGPDQTGWRKELEELAAKFNVIQNIKWTGMLRGDVKWGAYLNADAFILPSHQENFGIVVAEALSCGLPVLISDKIHIWREIKADHAGLIEKDTVQGCARLIGDWLAMDDVKRQHIVSNTRPCFNKHFEIKAAARNLIDAMGL